MAKINAGARPCPAARRVLWLMAAVIVAIVLVIGAGLGLSACVIQVGGGTDSTASSVTTDKSGVTGTTDKTLPSTSVVESGDGLASPAQAVGTILGPSVVNIKATMTISQGPFGQQETPIEGSGVIYTADGMIITNNHVVTNEYDGGEVRDLRVTLATGEILPATIVGRDPFTDLAVIQVDSGSDLPVATFVTEQPEVGEYAVAIGSPLGYENSVTLGIVSGLHRSPEDYLGIQGVAYNDLIQTDCPISPGNSGGPLANASGQVIGINVLYEPPTLGAVNIGFAIPSAVVTQVADQIIATGKATHAYLGVSTETVTAELQEQFGLSRSSGVLVAEVTSGGPAGKAGIQRGDIIIKIDDEDMVEASDVLMAIRDRQPGDTVKVTVDRDGTTSVITVTLEERPADL